MNSISCKFLYQPPLAGPGWDVGLYRSIGLEMLLEEWRCSHLNSCTVSGRRARNGSDCRGRPRVGSGARDGDGHVAVQRRRSVARQYSLPRGRPDAETGGEQSVCEVCNGCARGAHMRPQYLPDVAGALALPRAGSVGPVTQGAHHLHVCNACTLYMFISYTPLLRNRWIMSHLVFYWRWQMSQWAIVAMDCVAGIVGEMDFDGNPYEPCFLYLPNNSNTNCFLAAKIQPSLVPQNIKSSKYTRTYSYMYSYEYVH